MGRRKGGKNAKRSKIAVSQGDDDEPEKEEEKEDTLFTLFETLDAVTLHEISQLVALQPEVQQQTERLLACFKQPNKFGYSMFVRTVYKRPKGDSGRVYAKTPSLQNLKGRISRLVAHRYYREIDIKNCAPMCLLAVARRYDVSTSHLRQYVENRQASFDRVRNEEPSLRDATDAQLKTIFLRVIHGGSYMLAMTELGLESGAVPALDQLKDDVRDLTLHLRELPEYNDMYTKIAAHDGNINGRFISKVWQQEEFNIMSCIVEEFTRFQIPVGVLKHDGILIRSDGEIKPTETIRAEVQRIANTRFPGFNIEIAYKDLTPTQEDLNFLHGRKHINMLTTDEQAIHVVTQVAMKNNYSRTHDTVQAPHPTIPCVSVAFMPFKEFINYALACDADRSSKSALTKVILWMEQVDHPRFPIECEDNLQTSRVAFRNGYFDLDTLELHRWDDPLTDKNFKTNMYMEFDCPESNDPGIVHGTPTWDRMLSYQLPDPEDKDWFECTIGRLFYKVKKKDDWQITPWVVGDANTGKSTICHIVAKLFPADLCGAITASFEPRFGLQALCKKRVLITADTPVDIHRLLSAADFQSMVSGEEVSIARKGMVAIPAHKWTSPMLNASNAPAKWEDAAGSIKRRIWHFIFESLVQQLDTQFASIITTQELPYLFRRVIQIYHDKRLLVGHGDIWKFAPPMVLRAKDELCVVTDPLTEFINNGSRYFQCIYVQGAVTTLADLNAAFNKFMEHERKIKGKIIGRDFYPLRKAGFEVVRANRCKVCQKSPSMLNCGDHYNIRNKHMVRVVNHMELVDNRIQYGGDVNSLPPGPSDPGVDDAF